MARKWLVTRTPQTWLGTLVEAAIGTCGRSIIVGERWYRFKRRAGLVASDAAVAAKAPGLCIVDAGPVDPAQGEALGRLVGTKWSLCQNCVTVFAPYWKAAVTDGEPSRVSPGDRASIGRSVALTLIVAILVGFAVNAWMDSKMARLEAQQLKHYRSVVAHLGQIKARLKEINGE